MKSYPLWKPIVVLLVLAACVIFLTPPSQKLKPGLDLAGGTTLVYDVRIPENEQVRAGQMIDDIIAILRDRVDPTGTRNLIWRRQAGNRIEVQMALATAETGDRRQAYDRALEDLYEANIAEADLDATLRLSGEARTERIAELAANNAQRAGQLQELAAAYDALVAIEEPYNEVQQDYRAAQDRLEELEESETATSDERMQTREAATELEERLAQLAVDVADARQRYDQLREDVLEKNVEPFEIEAVLDQPAETKARDEVSPRAEALRGLKEDHPERADQIDRVAEAWASYEQFKGPLDDPNDLITLLQSSGVLEFRIAAVSPQTSDASGGGMEPNITDEQVAQFRERLQEEGPRSGLDENWRWFEIGSLERYIDEQERRDAVRENAAAALASFRGVVGAEYRNKFYLLLGNEPTTAMTQEQQWRLARANRTTDEFGTPAVGFSMGPRGADALARITRPNVGRPMAILLDGGIINTPTLQAVLSNRGIITGQFSPEYVDFLVRTLNSGSLDAQLGDYPILIKTTGPQLGADNLRSGVTAAVTALVVVAAFMVFYYFFSGLVATIALGANMIIILGIMAMIQATFTLPGIAGIVLTIGMAVDANVLVFERIREETRDGADLGTAIRLGFDKALSTIVDANLTTFITAVVLFYTATAEIKGFATTLMCGILATMFTSLILSRILIDGYHRLLKAKTLPMLPTVVPTIGRALSPNVNWISKRYGFFTISIILMGAGLGMVFARGESMLDIEFRSGTQVTFNVDFDLEGREVTPPDAIDANVSEGVEAPLVPIEEVRARLQLLP
ncbi:MAG: protein translocase subunit SecD, partial [Phycisphaeraceae bacterium]